MNPDSKTGYQILGQGLEHVLNPNEFGGELGSIVSAAFAAVFAQQEKGNLKWERSGEDLQDFSCNAVVSVADGNRIFIKAIFHIVRHSGMDPHIDGYLALGGKEHGPTLTTADPRVRNLWHQITGMTWEEFVKGR